MLAPTVEPQRPLVDAPGPEAQAPVPTTAEKLDETARRVRDGAARFARLSIDERIALARAMQAGYVRIAEATVRAGCAAKGIAFAAPAAAEEWATGPWCVIRHLRLVREQLESIRRTGNTRIGRVGASQDGRTTVQVFPDNAIDGLLFQGCRVEVRMQKGIGADAVANKRASFYRGASHDGRVTLVLGAGNLASIGPMDVITKLFNEGSACILKMSPVNAYLGPFLEQAFASAIERGYLAVVYGGAEQGAYLARHVSVDELHLTGSDATHDAIVWGPPGPEREARQRRGEPLCGKPVSSELGNVSPVIVVPGPYSERELAYQAEDIAGYVVMNAGFLCNAARVLITPRQWAPRTPFLQHVERVLQSVPPRKSYYPGAAERWWRLTDGRDQAIRIGRAEGDTLPWTVIPGLDAADRNEPLFTREAFCPVVAETSVGSSDPVEFLERAVEFANERLWGTLSATLVVHIPSS